MFSEIDVNAKERSLLDEEKARKAEISNELKRISLLVQVAWRQKSKAL